MEKLLTWKNLGWVLTALITLLIGFSAFNKVMGSEEMVKGFESMKLLPYMKLIGLGELVGLGLLIYPRTSMYGALLLSSFMSGAVAIHLSYMGANTIVGPILFGIIGWTAHCLRTYFK